MKYLALRASSRDPFRNLAIEEILLESAQEGERLLFLYVNDPCVVIGRNQNPWAEVSPSSSLPLLRRISGGGTVYHDAGNLNWALIGPRASHDQCAELAMVAGALAEIGVAARPGPRGGLYVDPGEGLPGPEGERKISGTARRLSASRVLHHGTLLVDSDLRALGSCLGGLKLGAPAALASVTARPVNLSQLVPGFDVESAIVLLARALGSGPPSPAESRAETRAVAEAEARLASGAWIRGATPSFSLGLPVPGGTARLLVKSGIVASAEGRGSHALEPLVGSEFDYRVRERAIALLDAAGESAARS